MKKPIDSSIITAARANLAEVLEELGAISMHLREAINFAELGSIESASSSVDDAQNAIDTARNQLADIREQSGRWAVWAEGLKRKALP
jgi:hypothetical protein